MSQYEPKYTVFLKDEQEREFKKTHYIKDKDERLKAVKTAIAINTNTVKVNEGLPESSFINIELKYKVDKTLRKKVEDLTESGMFYGNFYKAIKRRLEIEIYTDGILKTIPKGKVFEQICFLIDNQYKWHTKIFDTEIENVAFYKEGNTYIVDKLQDKINEISNLTPPPKNTADLNKKPLYLGSGYLKNTIPTILLELKKANVINGSVADIVKMLIENIDGFAESTITDILSNKVKRKQPQFNAEISILMVDIIKKAKAVTPKKTAEPEI